MIMKHVSRANLVPTLVLFMSCARIVHLRIVVVYSGFRILSITVMSKDSKLGSKLPTELRLNGT